MLGDWNNNYTAHLSYGYIRYILHSVVTVVVTRAVKSDQINAEIFRVAWRENTRPCAMLTAYEENAKPTEQYEENVAKDKCSIAFPCSSFKQHKGFVMLSRRKYFWLPKQVTNIRILDWAFLHYNGSIPVSKEVHRRHLCFSWFCVSRHS